MKPVKLLFCASAAAFAMIGASGASAATVTSTFDGGTVDGWAVGDIASAISTSADINSPPTYNATGGNPGGYISTQDTENIVAFLAPTKFTGDDSQFLGGTLSFDLQDQVLADQTPYPAVVLYSSTGQTISYTTSDPGLTFTSYLIPLTAAGWTVYPGGESNGTVAVTADEFAADLAGVTNLAIEADWHSGGDNTGLDNVVLASTAPMVSGAPEPGTWALMFGGLAMIGGMLRIANARRRENEVAGIATA